VCLCYPSVVAVVSRAGDRGCSARFGTRGCGGDCVRSSATAYRDLRAHAPRATSPRLSATALPFGAAKRAATGIYLRLRIIEVASVVVVASSFKARRRLADAAE
jgi:hypothetical protein